MKIHTLLLTMLVSAFALSGCDSNDGPAEKAGRAFDDAGEEIHDAAKDAGDAIKDACEEIKEGVDAKDTDC
jgi:predicted small secreted protein